MAPSEIVIRVDRGAFIAAAAVVLLSAAAVRLWSESLTLVTTYPSPSGIYNQIVTTGNSGSSPADTTLNRNAGNAILVPPTNAGGKVGIGISVPGVKLHIRGASDSGIEIDDSNGNARVLLGPSGAQHGELKLSNNANSQTIVLNSALTGPTYFNAGNVGIGTSIPSAKLQVVASEDSTALSIRGIGRTPQLELGRIGANDLYIGAAEGENNLANHAAAGDAVIGTRGGRLHLGVNKGNNAPIILEGASNTVYMQLGDAPAGQTMCYANSPWPWYYRIGFCSSSARNKHDVRSLALGLRTVMQLRPVTFRWQDQNDLGFVAEEVEKVSPILATYGPDGRILGVKYGQISAVIVKAMQEQERQLAALQETLREQEAKRLAKDARIVSLEARVRLLERSR